MTGASHLRVAATIQLALGVLFAVLALVFRERLQDDLFDGNDTLYWILIATVLAYAVSYFARGFLAGHRSLRAVRGAGADGGHLAAACSRWRWRWAWRPARTVVALGMVAAPVVSLLVVPFAFSRQSTPTSTRPQASGLRPRASDPRGRGARWSSRLPTAPASPPRCF